MELDKPARSSLDFRLGSTARIRVRSITEFTHPPLPFAQEEMIAVGMMHFMRRSALRAAGAGLLGIFLASGGGAIAEASPARSTTLSAHARLAAIPVEAFGGHTFTPQNPNYSASDTNGRIEASYNYGTSPGTFSWRYQVNPAICAGGASASATSDIYNNGGLVPNTHYSKVGVTPCYGFHASFTTSKINTKGNYQLRGEIKWRDGDATLTLDFTFDFIITDI
jgi:hypothetical protein